MHEAPRTPRVHAGGSASCSVRTCSEPTASGLRVQRLQEFCAVLRCARCKPVALFWQELEFQDLAAVLHCVHSFMAAKVASVDPAFMDTQSIAGRYMCSS